jgi:histidyl-tRNA synthetase
MQFRAVKGMNDILPHEVARWHRLEGEFRTLVALYGYQEVRTPLLEHTELFARSIGETTDVVEKEMFTFERSRESLTMRPEGTAGAARAYVTNKVHAREPISRWYYLGPMFRAEQPQRGRYRQFHQAGCEVFGDPGPLVDAEMIDLLCTYFERLGISGVEVSINSIGGAAAREAYRLRLLEFLRPRADALSPHARDRLEVNPLRVLDSKDQRDQKAVRDAPSILEVLDGADLEHWKGLCAALDALGVSYTVDPRLVRGLDYYTRTLFELKATGGDLGAQNTLVGGGRYDAMIETLGGPSVAAIGFAMGLERILLAMPDDPPTSVPTCYVAPIGSPAQREALLLASELRGSGVTVDLDGRGNSLRSMLRRADAVGARVCLVLGDSELQEGVVQVKDLEQHTQDRVSRSQVVERVVGIASVTAPGAATQTSGDEP